MDARADWISYVASAGGMAAVACKLQTPYSTIAGICAGNRGIGRLLAQRFASLDKKLKADRLIWVRPLQAPVATQPRHAPRNKSA